MEAEKKKATSTEEQIAKLRNRGMLIGNPKHVTEVLLSVGYYRMGFYWFPFEKSHKLCQERTHEFRKGTTWEKAEALYDFDDRFRNILSFYLQTIETDIRTFITYTASNYYKDDPTWFANEKYMDKSFLDRLDEIYNSTKRNPVLFRHHKKYHNDKYAPAWKTIEFFTFGETQYLYQGIKDDMLRQQIYERYNIEEESIFLSYFNVLRDVRNVCAHSHVLYDRKLYQGIKGRRDILGLNKGEEFTIVGILKLIYHILQIIDEAKEKEMRQRIKELVSKNEYDIVSFAISRIAF